MSKIFGKTLLALCLVFSYQSYSQGMQDSLKSDESDIISSIAPYPEDVRDAILDVSQYPQNLVKIERMQSRTSQSFQDQMAPFPRDVQEKFYEISRYPDLISQLVVGNDKSPQEIDNILKSYPAAIASTAKDLYPAHKDVLLSMNATYQDSDKTMNSIIGSLPDQTQRDFRKVIAMPDVMSLLTDRIDLTVSLGEAYRSDPMAVKQNLDSINMKLTAQNEKDLQDYKNKVASDPKMQEEMKQSAADFSNNYDEVSAAGNVDPNAGAAVAPDQQQPIVNNYYNDNAYANPYPYWFGYPYWYSSPVWYPRPLYYQTGFYIGRGGGLVVVGMPSYAYSNWFFSYGYRRYPRLYSHYNTYYNVHRNNITRVNVYRGFNTSARDHFYRANHIDNRNVNRGGAIRGSDARISAPARQNTAVRSQGGFRNSINYNGNNFNSRGVNNFHAQEFHQQTWHSVGGGGGGSRVSAPAQRSGGFSGGRSSGGGGHAGGGGGGRRGR